MADFHKQPYDAIPEDPRYKIANREALIGVILALLNFAWWYGFAYGLGSKPVAAYTFTLGFPDWFFYSCIIGFVVFAVLVYVVVHFLFQEIPFDDGGEDE